jgi:hypothetical protein
MSTVYYSILIFCFFLLLLNKKYVGKLFIFLALLLLSAITVEGLRFLFPNTIISNFAFSVYTPIEYTLLSIIYYLLLKKTVVRNLILISIPLFLILSFYVQFFLSSNNFFIKYIDVLIQSPLVCLMSILYLFEISIEEKDNEFKSNTFSWISIANILFFAGSFFSYAFGSFLLNKGSKTESDLVFLVSKYLNILLYILYAIGFIFSKWKKQL